MNERIHITPDLKVSVGLHPCKLSLGLCYSLGLYKIAEMTPCPNRHARPSIERSDSPNSQHAASIGTVSKSLVSADISTTEKSNKAICSAGSGTGHLI